MARAKDLAGLAALGFLGYKMSQMGKNKDDAGDQKTSSYTGDTKKVEAKDEPRRQITDYMKKAPEAEGDNYGNEGRRTSMGVETATKANVPKIEAQADKETNATNVVPGGSKKRTEGNQPMPSLKAVERKAAARQTSMSTDAMRNASRANVAGANRQKAMAADPEAQAAKRVYPEELLVGGPGVKAVAGMAKNLANRGGKEVAEYATPRLAAPAKQLTGPSKADLMARDRAARAAGRQEEMLKENAANYGLNPNAPGYDAAASSLRRNIGGDDFTIMKKGGAVKMTASRRGDGIASRGKTRGKIC